MQPTVCIGIEKDAKDSDMVTVGYYRCKASQNKIAATETAAVFSPYDGNFLKVTASDTVQMKVGDVRSDPQVTSTGACPTCATEHFVTANTLEHFVDDGNNMFCTLCGTEYEPLIDPEVLDNHADISDDDEEEDEDLTTVAADGEDGEDDEDETEEDDDDDDTNPPIIETQNLADDTTPANTVEPATPATETTNNDLTHGGEEVAASVKEFNINVMASAGDLTKQKLNLVRINDNYALVLADDQPIVKLYADKAGDNKKLFENYKTLSKAFLAILSETDNPDFSSIGGEPLQFAVNVDQQIAKKVEAGVVEATKNLQDERVTMAEEFSQSLMVAASIVNKNMDKNINNPLRDNMIATLSKLQIKNAAGTTDMILEAAAEEYINTIIAQAEIYRNKPLDSRNTIALFVNNANYNKNAVTAKAVELAADDRKDFADSLASNNVMFTTAGLFESAPVATEKAASAGVNYYRSLFKK